MRARLVFTGLFSGTIGLAIACLGDPGTSSCLPGTELCGCVNGSCQGDLVCTGNFCIDPGQGETTNSGDGDPGDGDAGDGDGDGNTDDPSGDGDGDSGDGDGDSGDGDGDGDTGDGDGDGEGDCSPGELPPETCTLGEEGFYWCTHTEAMGPECSQYFVCENGVWTENNASMDEICMFDGYDFAYGCVDNGQEVIFECGDGSGAACDNDSLPFCVDADLYGYCLFGKQTHDSCFTFCQVEGVDGQTYEYGECDDSDPNDVQCFCCDSGTPGCPI